MGRSPSPAESDHRTNPHKACQDFSLFELLEVLHSYQGRNFESTILQQTLEAFGIAKSRTTAYHPQGDSMCMYGGADEQCIATDALLICWETAWLGMLFGASDVCI